LPLSLVRTVQVDVLVVGVELGTKPSPFATMFAFGIELVLHAELSVSLLTSETIMLELELVA
jgi:hypothetical protein